MIFKRYIYEDDYYYGMVVGFTPEVIVSNKGMGTMMRLPDVNTEEHFELGGRNMWYDLTSTEEWEDVVTTPTITI